MVSENENCHDFLENLIKQRLEKSSESLEPAKVMAFLSRQDAEAKFQILKFNEQASEVIKMAELKALTELKEGFVDKYNFQKSNKAFQESGCEKELSTVCTSAFENSSSQSSSPEEEY